MYDIMNYIERKSDAKIANANTYLKWMKQHDLHFWDYNEALLEELAWLGYWYDMEERFKDE